MIGLQFDIRSYAEEIARIWPDECKFQAFEDGRWCLTAPGTDGRLQVLFQNATEEHAWSFIGPVLSSLGAGEVSVQSLVPAGVTLPSNRPDRTLLEAAFSAAVQAIRLKQGAPAGKTRPIFLHEFEIKAIVDGKLRQLRRPLDPQPGPNATSIYDITHDSWYEDTRGGDHRRVWQKHPLGHDGDRFWVRETWQDDHNGDEGAPIYKADLDHCGQCPAPSNGETIWFNPKGNWHPPVSMPRAMSRITLEVETVRVERLQDMSLGDIVDCGFWCDPPAGAIVENQKYPEDFESWTQERRDRWFDSTARATYMAQCYHSDQLVKLFRDAWDGVYRGKGTESSTSHNVEVGFWWDMNPWVQVATVRRVY